jgi:hypothetical protein
LVTIAYVGWRLRKLRSNSHASATKNGPEPQFEEPPRPGYSPPMRKPGSRRDARSAQAIMAVVVVLPWVPATAIPVLSAISLPRHCEYLRTGMPRSRAPASSGLSSPTAAEITIRSAWGSVA